MKLWYSVGETTCLSFFHPQTQSYSVLSGKTEVSQINGHHAESWKLSGRQSLHERSEKIKVSLTLKHFSVNKSNENIFLKDTSGDEPMMWVIYVN